MQFFFNMVQKVKMSKNEVTSFLHWVIENAVNMAAAGLKASTDIARQFLQIILGMGLANERRHYNVTPLVG